MSTYKTNRTAEDIKRELSSILRELKDPRIAGRLLSVTRVDTTADLSYAKVYVSAFEGMDTAKSAVAALTHASGLIRRELSDRLHIRKAPELKFIADNSIEQGMDIVRTMNSLNEANDDENR